MTFRIHNSKHTIKPNSFQVAIIQNSWNNSILTDNVNVLIEAISQGQTIKFNETNYDTLIIDADNNKVPLTDILDTLKKQSLTPSIAYETFSANDIKHNFRLIYFIEGLTYNAYYNFTQLIERVLNVSLDYSFVRNKKQVCYGTNKSVLGLKQDLIVLDYTPIKKVAYNALKTQSTAILATDINTLLSLDNKSAYKVLNEILKDKKHISYDLCLRWYFANFNNPKLQDEILELGSLDTQLKVLNLFHKQGRQYLLRLTSADDVFRKIYNYNLRHIKCLKGKENER